MENYLFCAGGSGARVLEAVMHLCAAGLGPDQFKILMIDPDATGGNLQITNQIINSYNSCEAAFGSKLGKSASFFKTKFSLFAADGRGGVSGAWSPVGREGG